MDKLKCSNPIQEDKTLPTYSRLILSGGGARGIAYIGALKALEELNIIKNFRVIMGTSIGALFAVFIVLGFTSREIQSLMSEFKLTEYFSVNLENFLTQYGLDSFQRIGDYLVKIWSTKGMTNQTTMLELFNQTGIHLAINTVCLNLPDNYLFDHIKTPDATVLQAVQASMTLPFVFQCVSYRGLSFIDGGILDNLATHLCPHPTETQKTDKTLILHLTKECPISLRQIGNLSDYCTQLFKCFGLLCQRSRVKLDESFQTIQIPVQDCHVLQFNQTPEKFEDIIQCGYKSLLSNLPHV
jgi:NTE family protein